MMMLYLDGIRQKDLSELQSNKYIQGLKRGHIDLDLWPLTPKS